MHATILFAHGSRRPSWRRPFDAILARMQAQAGERPVRLAFLELCEPSIGAVADELVALGVDHIQVVPLFMSSGGHVLRDLPPQLEEVQSRHVGLQFQVEPAIGEHPLVLDAIGEILRADS